MKRLAALGLALAALAAPAFADQPTTSPADADLACVAWTGYLGSKAASEEDKRGLMLMMFFYIGRWEAETGQGIDTALTPDWISANLARIFAAGPDCQARGKAVADRMTAAGSRLKNNGKK